MVKKTGEWFVEYLICAAITVFILGAFKMWPTVVRLVALGPLKLFLLSLGGFIVVRVPLFALSKQAWFPERGWRFFEYLGTLGLAYLVLGIFDPSDLKSFIAMGWWRVLLFVLLFYFTFLFLFYPLMASRPQTDRKP
jgi:hypothetical protein